MINKKKNIRWLESPTGSARNVVIFHFSYPVVFQKGLSNVNYFVKYVFINVTYKRNTHIYTSFVQMHYLDVFCK